MLKKTVSFEDFDGHTQTEDLYFHLTKAELIEFVSQYPEDFQSYVKKIALEDRREELVFLFRNLILKSYGVREGSHFRKTADMAEEFSHTEAYSQLFMELFSATDNLINFFNGVLGVDLKQLAEQQAK